MDNTEEPYWKACEGCIFYYDYIHSCNYIFVTGKQRGCAGGIGCKKKMCRAEKDMKKPFVIKRKKEKNAKKQEKVSMRYLEREKRFGLWKQGLNDTEIAEACGVTAAAIHQFRRFNHLPPNSDSHGNKIIHDWEKYTL